MKILTIVKKTGDNFIRHYTPYFPAGSKVVHKPSDAFEAIPHFDIVIFEWANDLTAQIINSEKFGALRSSHNFKTVVRVHDHEVTKVFDGSRRIDWIHWGRVDKIWFINPGIQSLFIQLKGFQGKTFFLPNAVDSKHFPESQMKQKKVGFLSIHYRERKRIDRVISIARLLPDWLFYVRAHIPRPNEQFHEEYVKIRDMAVGVPNVIFEHRDAIPMIMGGYDYADLKKWYADKAVILSTSDHEGFHYAIAEGALCGCMPVVWNWPTSEVFWNQYVVNNIELAAATIANYKPSNAYREYIEKRFSPQKLVAELLAML